MIQDQIETVCAWCVPPKHISGPVGAEHVSHGICPECLAEKFPEEGGMMTLRERQIHAVAVAIADLFWAYRWTTNGVAEQNRTGWAVDVSNGTKDGWLRCEDVVLTPDELDQAIKWAVTA